MNRRQLSDTEIKQLDDFCAYRTGPDRINVPTVQSMDELLEVVASTWRDLATGEEPPPKAWKVFSSKDGKTLVIAFDILGKLLMLAIPRDLVLDRSAFH